MSWVLDVVQEFLNYEQKVARLTEAYKKLELANQQQLETIKQLTQEKGEGSKS